MKIKLQELKIELKGLSASIRELKNKTKEFQRGHGGDSGTLGIHLRSTQKEYRHKHIVYCLLRGRTMEQIEKGGNRPGNEPSSHEIKILMEKYNEETIHPAS